MYTPITKQDSDILVPYIANKNSPDYQTYKTLSSGIVLSANNAYSISSGTVLFVGQNEDDKYTIIVQYNGHQCFSYNLLDESTVSYGDIVLEGIRLGTCTNKMRFEYLTANKNDSLWAVRISGLVYYKQNPIRFIKNDTSLSTNTVSVSGYNIQTIFRDGRNV